MTLRKQAFSGVRWTTISSFGRAVLQIAQIGLLARLLAPADFGLIAVVLALMAFLQIFADAGVSNAIIHHQDLTPEHLSSLYWLNVGAALLLATVLIAISPWLAAWYQQPVLRDLFMLAAISMAIGALGQQLRVTAQKELRFAQLAKLDLGATLCGFAVTIVLAWFGAGVYSLAFGSLANATAGCAIAWIVLARGWRPQRRFALAEIRPSLKFGGYMIGTSIANTFNAQIDVLLGGRILGPQALGLYTVPKNLTLNVQMVINPVVTQVGLPVMAKVQQDLMLLKRVYLQTMRMTASINFPIYIAMVLFAPEIVHLMLSDKWASASPLLAVFGWWGLLRSITNPVGSLLYATGKAALSFKWNVALLLLVGPVVWVGAQFGVMGMAYAMTGLMAALYIPCWYFLVHPSCGASLREYSAQLVIPLLLALVSGFTSYGVVAALDNQVARLLIGLTAGGLSYVALSWKFNRTWVDAMMELIFRIEKR